MTPTVNRNIKAELARSGFRQADLAQKLKIGAPALSRRLAGTVPWTLEELTTAAEFLGVQPVDLMTERMTTTEES